MPMNPVDIPIDELIPYERNAKIHDENQIQQIANSLLKFGWKQPVVIDKNNIIIVGHGRVEGAKIARQTNPDFDKAPCIIADDLTDEEIKAYRLADNKLNESPWDVDLLSEEMAAFTEIDMSEFGIDLDEFENELDPFDEDDERERLEAEFAERMAQGENLEEDEEYQKFKDKFKPKRTTDDCYTPANIYEAVKSWAVCNYNLKGRRIVRPFYPNGNYRKEEYRKGDVVIDNPPFSILSEICKFYAEKKIDFFLFGPRLTIFSSSDPNVVIINEGIVYENGANVATAFTTNLGEYKVRTAPDLEAEIKRLNKENIRNGKAELPQYSYPNNVLTSQMMAFLARYGQDVKFKAKDMYHIRELDCQKEHGKVIYGAGFLISEKAAAEKAAAEKAAAEKAAAEKKNTMKWELSEREIEIVKKLG